MDKTYVDLHIHSCYSDGTLSPQEIVEAACANGVGLLAIADHNTLEGSLRARELCEQSGIRLIPAVEIDSFDRGVNFHILAYGMDVHDREFREFIGTARFLLDEASVRLAEAMEGDYDNVSVEDYLNFTYDCRLGGWAMLHYLRAKGLTSSLKEGGSFYPRYHISHDKNGFSSIRAVCCRIKRAGGYAVLAHPGELIESSDIAAFRAELQELISRGLDGVECYYPSHSAVVTQACLDICDQKNLLITAGSDCHGQFGATRVGEVRVGEMGIVLEKVRLGELLKGHYGPV